jgi:DNA-binding NarL/FixJ family response regulator
MEFVKARRELAKLPIIVYSASNTADDKRRAFNLGANAYICKSAGVNDLMTYVKSVVAPPPH